MPTIHENLTAQVNGITDTFTTTNSINDGVVVEHNGQVVLPPDVTILSSTSFELSFIPQIVPTPKDTLAIFITPDVFNITAQIDGITNVFTNDVSDTSQGEFVAILNGQILSDDTTTISTTSFSIPTVPQIGDTLEYIRSIECDIDPSDIILPLGGSVRDTECVFGAIEDILAVSGMISDTGVIKGSISDVDKVEGRIANVISIYGTINLQNTC